MAAAPHRSRGFDDNSELAFDTFAGDASDQFLDRALHGTDHLVGRLRFKAAAAPLYSKSRISCLPMFPPVRTEINAAGAFTKPLTIVSR